MFVMESIFSIDILWQILIFHLDLSKKIKVILTYVETSPKIIQVTNALLLCFSLKNVFMTW